MTEQEIYVLNALSGKPAADVTKIAYLIPDLINSTSQLRFIHTKVVRSLKSFVRRLVGLM